MVFFKKAQPFTQWLSNKFKDRGIYMKIAFVYSGQGSQKVGMGKDFYTESDIFKSAFDLLAPEKKEIAFEGPSELLGKTANTQGILTAFNVGITDMLKSAGITPVAAMGLSLGEYSALYAADVFHKQQVIDIINFRADEMTKAAQGVECKMAAILMLNKEIILTCCEKASRKGLVSIANYNCPGQIVISGEKEAVEFAAELCKEVGAKRCVFLDTEGAFHTQLMENAYEALKTRFECEKFGEASLPVILNATALPAENTQELKDKLALQVKSSVNFEESIKYMHSLGVDTVIEIGCGKTLSGFIKKTVSGINTYSIEDIASFNSTVEAIK